MKTEPQKEHEWLRQFVGEWTHKSECSMEPGKPPEKFEGSESATSGKGAVYAWEGNNDVGQGRMDIAASVPPSKVAIKLDFVKPFEAHIASSSRWSLKKMSRTSHGPCRAICLPLQNLSTCFSTWTVWSARTSRPVLANLKTVAEK